MKANVSSQYFLQIWPNLKKSLKILKKTPIKFSIMKTQMIIPLLAFLLGCGQKNFKNTSGSLENQENRLDNVFGSGASLEGHKLDKLGKFASPIVTFQDKNSEMCFSTQGNSVELDDCNSMDMRQQFYASKRPDGSYKVATVFKDKMFCLDGKDGDILLKRCHSYGHPDIDDQKVIIDKVSDKEEITIAFKSTTETNYVYRDENTLSQTSQQSMKAVVWKLSLETIRYEKYFKDLSFTDIKGRDYEVESLKAPIVILNFWATWCPNCRRERPSLVKLQKKYSSDKLRIIGISPQGERALSKIKSVVKGDNVNYLIVVENGREIAKNFAVSSFPVSFIFYEGRLVDVHTFSMNFTGPYMSNKIKRLLSE